MATSTKPWVKANPRLQRHKLDMLIAHIKTVGRMNGWTYPKELDEQ